MTVVPSRSRDGVRMGLAGCGQYDVVVTLSLRNDVEEGVAHERDVHGPPAGVGIGGRRRGMSDMTKVHGDVTGLRVDSHYRVPRLLVGIQLAGGVPVRARQDAQLPVGRAGFVELDTDVEAWTEHRVATQPAVLMPREVGETLDHVGVLDDH